MIQLFQIIFILSVLVILHEFGHYIPAKLFKVRVEKFYLFMDPWFSVVKKKIKDTEWGIGWLPIGGYVKLAGMMDESMDKEQMQQPAQPWEFRAKPAWQRLIIMLGGVTVNILLAWLIYSVTYSTTGKKIEAVEKIQQNGLAFGETGHKVGFQNGDKIIAIDGKKYDDFKYMVMSVLFGNKVEIERAGKKIDLFLTDEQKGEIIKKEGRGFVGTRNAINYFFIDSVAKNNYNIQRFDQIIGANQKRFVYLDELSDAIRDSKDSLQLLVKRDGKEFTSTVKIDSTGKNGINLKGLVLTPNYVLADAKVNMIIKDFPADKAGITYDDKIVGVNQKTIVDYKDFKKQIASFQPNQKISLNILRNNKPMDVPVTLDKNLKLGLNLEDKVMENYIERNVMPLSAAIPAAVSQTWNMFVYNINSFKLLLKPKTGAIMQIKSPIGIARQLPDQWDWEFVWNFIAMFSVGLAFMNLLPIPGLDGGHALFTIAEMITGKTLSDKAAERVQTIGMVILLSLMAFTFGKDIYQWVAEIISKK